MQINRLKTRSEIHWRSVSWCLVFMMLFLCFWLWSLCMWIGEGRQGVWILLRTSRALQEQSACPSTTPALKHTQDKLILQSSTLSAPTHSTPAPWLLHSLAASPSPSQPLTHTFPPSPILSSRSMIDHVLCSCSFSPPFVPAQIINASIPQTVHIHFLQQTSLCGVTEWILVQLHVWHKGCYFPSRFTSILYDLTHPA